MTKFYNLSEKEKRSILEEASKRLDMPIFNVEKDWWVTQTLTLVFNMDIGKHLVFKGGTSLSKSWGITEREFE